MVIRSFQEVYLTAVGALVFVVDLTLVGAVYCAFPYTALLPAVCFWQPNFVMGLALPADSTWGHGQEDAHLHWQ